MNNSDWERLLHVDRLPGDVKERVAELDCLNAYVLAWGKTPHTATPNNRTVSQLWRKHSGPEYQIPGWKKNEMGWIDERLSVRRKEYYATLDNAYLWLGPMDKDWHSPLGISITATMQKGHHARSDNQVKKLAEKQKAYKQRKAEERSNWSQSSYSSSTNWWDRR